MNTSDEAKEFYGDFGIKLLRDFIGGNPRTEKAILFACEKLAQFQRTDILDLGYGLGWSSHEFARALPDSRILGIDLSPELQGLASAMFGGNPSVRYECHDLCDPSWEVKPGGGYDACVMLDVYEHIPRAGRQPFHSALAAKLSEDGILILTCPSLSHQAFLRSDNPSGLQPVDEDVSFDDLVILANELSAEIVHLEHRSVWSDNDYLHAVISRRLPRKSPATKFTAHRLLAKPERLKRLDLAKSVVGEQAVLMIKEEEPTMLGSMARRLRRRIAPLG